MKIRITTDRMPWINDQPHPLGAEVVGDDAEAQLLIDEGFAEVIPEPAPAKAGK